MDRYIKAGFKLSKTKDGVKLQIENESEVLGKLGDEFLQYDTVECNLSACIRLESGPKTNNQLAFIKGPLLDKIHEKLQESGYACSRDFVYQQLKRIFYNETETEESLKDGGFERVRNFIFSSVVFAICEYNIDFEDIR